MKRTTVIVILALLGIATAISTASAARRAKPLKAYLSGARIAIVEGRPEEALTLLDSISINYGEVPEAYDLSYKVYVDLMESAAGVEAKRPYLDKMVLYIDSLHMACENEEIDKDLKEDCQEFIEFADSTKLKYWREYYNLGIEQLNAIERLKQQLETETDSSRQAYIRKDIQQNIDSVIANMGLVILIDSADHRPYVAIGNAYEKQGSYEKAIEWMERGYKKADDPTSLLLPLAYNYIQLDNYCGAIPFYEEYIQDNPDDAANLFNLSICYNNCGLDPENRHYLDSAMSAYAQILELQPDNVNVLANAGRYYIMQAQVVSDSASRYRREEKPDSAEIYDSKRREMFDSARTYFGKAFELVPDNAMIAEQFAFTSALLNDCATAVTAFEKVAEARPEDAGNWTSMGDCYLQMGEWENAIRAYEQVAELTPGKPQIWENLAALYKEVGQDQKSAAAARKVKELTGGSGQ